MIAAIIKNRMRRCQLTNADNISQVSRYFDHGDVGGEAERRSRYDASEKTGGGGMASDRHVRTTREYARGEPEAAQGVAG
jgi:hypothetical protein